MMQVCTARTIGAIGTERQREMALRIARGIWKRVPPHVPLQDLEQVALTELWEAIERKGEEASMAYLVICVRGRVKDELRRHDWLPRYSRQNGLNWHVIHSTDIDEGFEASLCSHALSPEESIDSRRALAQIADAPLGERDRHVLRLHYEGGHKFKDIAAELGISEPRVSQIHHRAIAIVKAWLTGDITEARAGSHYQIPLRLRKAIMEKHAAHSDGHSPDPAPGGAPPEPRSADTFLSRVRAGRLGMAPARAPDRPVPGGGGTAEPRAAEPPELRDAATAPTEAPGRRLAEPSPEESEPVAVPSVLPEDGIDLRGELMRYRDWLIEQALIQTGGHQRKAADLLGLHENIFGRVLKRGRCALTGLRSARGKPAAAPSPAMKPQRRRAEHGDSLSEVISRLPRNEIAEWQEQGKSTGWIARQLTNRIGAGHALVEMAVRRTVASMADNGGV